MWRINIGRHEEGKSKRRWDKIVNRENLENKKESEIRRKQGKEGGREEGTNGVKGGGGDVEGEEWGDKIGE